MRKLILLFALLMLSIGLWANYITYTATSALQLKYEAFDVTVRYHSWSPDTKVGMITFDGDVTKIGDLAFTSCDNMTSITLPNTITKIGDQAFMECTSLATIIIPDSVTTIGIDAFHKCMDLTSITIPNAVTEIGNQAFMNCASLTSVTFMGAACQNAIATDAFKGVAEGVTTTLTLPEDWKYANAPESNSTAWHGGKFNSNIYSTDGATDKQNAITAVTAILGEYSTSAYLQSLLAEEAENINNAVNRHEVNERKQAAIDKLEFAVTSYGNGQAESLGEMGTPCEDCPSVEVKKGDKTIKLYNPESVTFKKE